MLFSIVKQILFSILRKFSLGIFEKTKYAESHFISLIINLFARHISRGNHALIFTDAGEYQYFIKKCSKSIIQDNIQRANEILENKFNLLGIKNISWGREIPWHSDLFSRHTWENRFHEELHPVSTAEDDYEKKNPWELSRLQYVFILYKAYLITRNLNYKQKTTEVLDDWLHKNPPFVGINWINSMEVGLRATNMILILSYGKAELSEKLVQKVERSLLFHFFYILLNPEFSFSRKFQIKRGQKIGYLFRNNHYLFDLLGLVFICLYFNQNFLMRLYGKRAVRLFLMEIEFQVLDDGVDFEGSIGYHGFVLEAVLVACILLKKRKIKIPTHVLEKVHSMLDFTFHYSKPDGTFPIIGDSDSGRVFTLGKYVKESHLNLLTIGSTFLKSCQFKCDSLRFSEEPFWLLGKKGKKTFESLPLRKDPPNSKAFEEGGFYVMRHGADHMIVSIGKNIERGSGGHFHNECLSFELYAGDKSFIIDPGCYTYASKKWRNLFRSTRYHNTVVLNDEEINRFDENNMFFMENDARAKVLKWETDRDFDIFVGEHYGYTRLREPVTFRREIIFNKKERYWRIEDGFLGKGRHQVEWNFHFAPMELQISRDNPLMISTCELGTNLRIEPGIGCDGLSAQLLDGWISKEYGVKVQAPILSYRTKIDLETADATFVFQLTPFFA